MNMTKEEAQSIMELHIHVTPLTEDAFYAFREIDDKELEARLAQLPSDYESGDEEADRLMEKFLNDIAFAERARERWFSCSDPQKRMKALNKAYQMIENQKKYGYPCLEWWPD